MRGLAGGKKPKTVEQLKRSGQYRKHRHDTRAASDQFEPIGKAPTWLDADERRQFNILVKRKQPGFLTVDDTESLSLLAHLHVKLMRRELKMTDVTTFRLLSREFGNTPDSRMRMPLAQKSDEKDPFDELMNRRKVQEVA